MTSVVEQWHAQENARLLAKIERLRAALHAIGYDYEIVEREGAAAFARRALADQAGEAGQ